MDFDEPNEAGDADIEHKNMELSENLASLDTMQELLAPSDIKQEIINPNDAAALSIDLELFQSSTIKQEVTSPHEEQDSTNLCDEIHTSALNHPDHNLNLGETVPSDNEKTTDPDIKTNPQNLFVKFDLSKRKNKNKKSPPNGSGNILSSCLDTPHTSIGSAPKSPKPAKVKLDIEIEGKTLKGVFQCKICSKICRKAYSLTQHEKMHLNEPGKSVQCGYCDLAFNNAYALKEHERKEHGERLKCSFCLFTCTRALGMKLHEKIHMPSEKAFKCKYCPIKCGDMMHLRKHESAHIGQVGYVQIKCERCSTFFDRETSLKIHKQMQNSKKKCSIVCDKCYNPRNDLKEPETKKTDDGEELKCKFCSKTFSLNVALKNHERKHIGEKIKKPIRRNKCYPCGKIFKDVKKLITHAKIHTGERLKLPESFSKKVKKPYQCMYCGKLFQRLLLLQEHEWTHTGERPYQCLTCGETFSKAINWKEHEQRHTGHKPFKCDYCGRGFWRRSYFVTHTRVHTGERPYSCQYCAKSFRTPTQKKQHERVHTGEKPYKCKHCDKTFSHGSNKKEHEKTHKVKNLG